MKQFFSKRKSLAAYLFNGSVFDYLSRLLVNEDFADRNAFAISSGKVQWHAPAIQSLIKNRGQGGNTVREVVICVPSHSYLMGFIRRHVSLKRLVN